MSKNRISTGSYDFNKWLFGGWEKDVISMIAGPPGSGKTNFAMLVACSQAKKGNKVIFIDTEGGFSVDRVKQIVGENYEEILKHILLLEPVDFSEQKKVFESLLGKVKNGHVSLIVVDGMATLYRLELGEVAKLQEEDEHLDKKEIRDEKVREVNREVAKQMRILAEICRKEKIPILITNQVYSEFLSEEELKEGKERRVSLVGGDLFKYWSKCILELRKDGRKRKAMILKHRSLPEKELSFEIRNEGIFKKGWI